MSALTGGPEPGLVEVKYDALEDSEGVPLKEWQPRGVIRPLPPPLAAGTFPPEEIPEGMPVQMHYNDGWWGELYIYIYK